MSRRVWFETRFFLGEPTNEIDTEYQVVDTFPFSTKDNDTLLASRVSYHFVSQTVNPDLVGDLSPLPWRIMCKFAPTAEGFFTRAQPWDFGGDQVFLEDLTFVAVQGDVGGVPTLQWTSGTMDGPRFSKAQRLITDHSGGSLSIILARVDGLSGDYLFTNLVGWAMWHHLWEIK